MLPYFHSYNHEVNLFGLPPTTDLLELKDIIRDSYQLSKFGKNEHDLITKQN